MLLTCLFKQPLTERMFLQANTCKQCKSVLQIAQGVLDHLTHFSPDNCQQQPRTLKELLHLHMEGTAGKQLTLTAFAPCYHVCYSWTVEHK